MAGAWAHTACACVAAEEVLCEKAGEPESFQEKMAASAKVLRLGTRVRLRTALEDGSKCKGPEVGGKSKTEDSTGPGARMGGEAFRQR